ncbi:hypothetical protein [Paraburkholderia sacchari]|uniref:hypothetical protein n=1 Tax=Paraburkholderia sacchari TaxID=159450 RepID=UPI000541B69B|nr:hypothetical protein [Paraburkholderia sacchari]NLP64959.1 hypothetical protein [Paraburkholderia sacchari]
MSGVLTTASNVTCGHAGNVSTSSSTKLQVNGAAVLLQSGIAGQSIAGCSTPPASDASGPTAKPCTTVASVTGGPAGKLQADSQPVMLDTLAGTTDGMVAKTTPQQLLAGIAGQTKLTAS